MSETDFLPPATFEFLVLSLKMQAEVQLGLMHFGEESDRPEPNLPLARHTIDMLGVLMEKTKGNLATEEHRLLENSITELRFRYVYVSEQQAAKPAAAEEPAAKSEQAEA
ncbi:MAG TPA: DUF1844 domain-containing protein [Bryobacteraceae bacterium]|nr:DUF1844 domain-containing protein [Bryobacteraceae bacterium]